MTVMTHSDLRIPGDLLVVLAESVVELHLQSAAQRFFLPYANVVQLALDRIGFACLVRACPPPRSVAELMTWCKDKAIVEWPISLADDLVPPGARQIFDEAVAGRSPQTVEACRDLLLGRVLVDQESQWKMFREPRHAMAWKLVGGLYEAPPRSYVVDRTMLVCGSCGLLAVPMPNGTLWCEADGCPRADGAESYEAARVRVLSYPLRIYFSLAGRAELAVRSLLAEHGFTVQAVPDRLGAFTVASSGGSRILRVHDRAEPVLHALEFVEERGAPAGEELIVMPRRAFDRRIGYAPAFAAALPPGARVPLVPDDLVVKAFDRRHGGDMGSFDA
jgi:hypothetical protein